MAIESTDFPPCSKTYVALKSRFIHSSHQLTTNLDLFLLFLLFAFYLFIYLFRIQRKPFVQREGVYRALCPEPMMVMNYAKNEFKLPNMIPIWVCNIRLQTKKTTTEKKTNKQKKTQKIKLKKNAIRRDHIWKQALRYKTTSLKF